MAPARRKSFLVSLVAAVAAGAFAFTYWVLSQQATRSLRPPEVEEPFVRFGTQVRRPDVPAAPRQSLPKTTPTTLVVRRTYYAECGDELVEKYPAGARLAGRTAEEIAQLVGPGTIESFSERTVVVLVTANGACPKHVARRYLGISDGHVAVFQGRPGGSQAKVVEVFDLEVGALPEREVQDLRRGVPVASDDELKRVLQSYLELAGF